MSLEFGLTLRVNRVDIYGRSPIMKGSTVCLKCLYKLNYHERFDGIEWFKDGKPFLHLMSGTDNEYNNKSVPYKLIFDINGDRANHQLQYLSEKC